MALVVCETFASLMGESTRAGVPAYFIRLTGCNLRCRYCDTTYAYEGGSAMTVGALADWPGPSPTGWCWLPAANPCSRPRPRPC